MMCKTDDSKPFVNPANSSPPAVCEHCSKDEEKCHQEGQCVRSPWAKPIRDRWFLGSLIVSLLLVMYLFSPFLFVLLVATVLVVVTWPVYGLFFRLCGRRKIPAVSLMLLFLAIIVFIPLFFLGITFVEEGIAVGQQVSSFLNSGGLENLVTWLRGQFASIELPQVIERLLPTGSELQEALARPLASGVMSLLNTLGSRIPQVVNATVDIIIQAIIFVFAVATLYMEGPRLLQFAKRLSPIDDDYEESLFIVFRKIANSMVVGSLSTALLQGVVAGVGYAIAGIDRVVFFAILTAFMAFVPLIGTAIIWLPLSLVVWVQSGPSMAIFLVAWSLILTTQVDQLVKPLFLHSGSKIHPLLIFLAFFGGMAWMGLAGILVGPVLVALFLALYTIFERDFLHILPEDDSLIRAKGSGDDEDNRKWWAKVLQVVKRSTKGSGATLEKTCSAATSATMPSVTDTTPTTSSTIPAAGVVATKAKDHTDAE